MIAGCKQMDGYIKIGVNGRHYKAHRIAWLLIHGYWPEEIDHINGDGYDNRLSNLREVTHKENQRNQKLLSNNKSGTCGVFWKKQDSVWGAQIKINGRQKHLGYFKDKSDAILARKAADREHGFHENHGRR